MFYAHVLLESPLMCTLNNRTDKQPLPWSQTCWGLQSEANIWTTDLVTNTAARCTNADLCLGSTCTNTVKRNYVFCFIYLFAGTVWLQASRAVYVEALQDHWQTGRVGGQRKSFVLFRACKSRGLAPCPFPTHTFFLRFWLQIIVELDLRSLSVPVHSHLDKSSDRKHFYLIWFSSGLKETFTLFGCLLFIDPKYWWIIRVSHYYHTAAPLVATVCVHI